MTPAITAELGAAAAADRHSSRPSGKQTSRRQVRSPRRSQAWAGLALATPCLVLVGVLLLVPIGQAVFYSMTNWDGVTTEWLGLSAWVDRLSDPTMLRVLQNNLALLAVVPLAMLIPLGVAVMLNEHVWGWRFFRTVFFLPTAVSWVVIGMVANNFYEQQGLLNQLFDALGLGFLQTDMLANERTALLALLITFVWSMIGTNTIIFLTGLSTVDPSTTDAARVDGAGWWRSLWSVTLPQLKHFLRFAFVITLVTGFTALFSLIYVMTGGGPGYGTTTLEYYVYERAFGEGAFGHGAFYGLILFVIVSAVSLIQARLIRPD